MVGSIFKNYGQTMREAGLDKSHPSLYTEMDRGLRNLKIFGGIMLGVSIITTGLLVGGAVKYFRDRSALYRSKWIPELEPMSSEQLEQYRQKRLRQDEKQKIRDRNALKLNAELQRIEKLKDIPRKPSPLSDELRRWDFAVNGVPYGNYNPYAVQ